MLSLIVAYRSFGRFRQASTHLDTPPFSSRHHPVSLIAPVSSVSIIVLDRCTPPGASRKPSALAHVTSLCSAIRFRSPFGRNAGEVRWSVLRATI